MRSALLRRTIASIAVFSLTVAAYDFVFGGFHFYILGIRISSWEIYKPFSEGLICAALAFWLHDRQVGAITTWTRLARRAGPLACIAVILSIGLAFRYGTFVAGGSDSYGYVSEAARWRSGQLIVPERLAALGDSLGASIVPLGYRLADVPGSSVPICPPGLPLLMAAASIVAGANAVYFVVPILGALGVWLTYRLGERVAGRRAGLVAAIALACSPIFVFQTLAPMSDIPVTAWWLAAWVLALEEGSGTALLAGLAASAAILTRPNLAPLALVVLGVAALKRPGLTRGVWFVAGVVPGCLAVASINRHLYGSPLSSGYGSVDMALTWERALTNLQRYPAWLVQLQSAAILLAFLAPFVGRRNDADDGGDRDGRIVSVWMLIFCVVVLLCYLFYTAFGADEWPYLRFMLPAIPFLLVLSSHVALSLIARVPLALRGASVALLCTLIACWYLTTADRLGVFKTATTERRYVDVGRYLGDTLPPNAVVLSQMESGTVRWYGNRPTVRWDLLPAGQLDPALDALRKAGYVPYILLEDWERNQFRNLFAENSLVGRVDWPPAIQYRGPISVLVYSPDDRDRSVRGEKFVMRIVPGG